MLLLELDAAKLLLVFGEEFGQSVGGQVLHNGLVFSAKGGDVAMTMVRGKILYQNGKFPTIDLPAVIEDLTTYALPKLFTEEKK